ncbi:MAG: hypothetical protein EXR72_00215 [Myxococcales bacterium]|nr:hypothetical protein [Myxococcales bacterium]
MRRLCPLALLLSLSSPGCATSHLASAVKLDAWGDHRTAAEEYATCIRDEQGLLDCYLGLGELHRPDGALADCKKFSALAVEVKARHGGDEAFTGPHARERIAKSALHYRDVDSIADWFERASADCKLRQEEQGELRVGRKERVLAHPCARRRKEPIEGMAPAQAAELASDCDDFRRSHLTDAGIDPETDLVIAEALVQGALTSLDEAFVKACGEGVLATACPPAAELRGRMRKRVRTLATDGPAAERLDWAKVYLKRWPDEYDLEKIRAARERATLDLALAQPGGTRTTPLEEFLRAYPESLLRDEALKALWIEARVVDSEVLYRELIAGYPEAPFVKKAKARLADLEAEAKRKGGH